MADNIIWIFGDQHPAHALSLNGNENLSTPNIDGMAARGFNFYQAVAGYPLCCPFRGSLLTSKYPHECVPGHQYRMDPAMYTVAHAFKDAGYKTAYFGKWHLDGAKERKTSTKKWIVPPERRGGFDVWIGYENNNEQWNTWVHGFDGEKEIEQYKLPDYETNELTSLLVKYIEDMHSESTSSGDEVPFFAVLSVQPPHNPYLAPEENMEKFYDLDTFKPRSLLMRDNVPGIPRLRDQAHRDIAGAFAMIENLDMNVGRVLDALERCKIGDRTHVMFFSDHGDMHGSHGHFRKTTPYEESIRIPFIIGGSKSMKYDKSAIPDGLVDAVINHVDIAPTSLGLAGIPVPSQMVGYDYSHYCRGGKEKDDEPDSAYIQSIIPTGHHDCIDLPWRGVVTRDGWKYVCFENTEWLMFNLNEDPLEQSNMAHYSRYRIQKTMLNMLLEDWIEETCDKFSIPQLNGRYEKMEKQNREHNLLSQFRDGTNDG